MNANLLLSWLGHSPSQLAFDTWLIDHRIHGRPHTPEQDEVFSEDPDAAFENARASEIEEVERDSVCLIYDVRDNYRRLFGTPKSEGEFVLKEVAFYAAGVQRFPGFKEALPFGLAFTDTRDQVHAKLGQPTARREVHELTADLYLRENIVVNVSYREDNSSIAIIHVRLPHCYDLRVIGKAPVEHDPHAVDLQKLAACLDKSAYDETLESLLAPLGWQSGDFEMADCDEVPNLIKPYGLALYYRDAKDYNTLKGQRFARDGAVFAGFRVNRRGDMASDGYPGALPLGIEFHHSPEEIIEQVGRAPDWRSIGDDIGAYKWKLSGCVLHVMFSLIDYQVYRVSCFAKFMEAELFARAGD